MTDIRLGAADWDQLKAQLARVKRPIGTASTLPPVCYSDPEIFQRELATVFQRSWVGIGRVDRWPERGDYVAMEVAGAPIIALRDGEGALRAYANSCRHRGARLLDGQGRCRTIRCPFHRWTYGLDGRLLVAPHMDRTAEFDADQYGLVPLRIGTRDGFVFVSCDSTAPSLQDWLGDFSVVHEPWTLGDMITTRRREFEVACNWKSFLEVFNEYYHLPYVHPDSINDRYGTPDDPDEVTGQFVTQFGTTQGSSALLPDSQDQALPIIESLSGRNRRGTRYTWIFPNTTFAAGSEAIWVFETYPVATDRTLVGMTACFPAATVARSDFEERARHYYERFDAAIEEDITALENQQAGLTSPLARQGRFSCLEPNVANFACWYADRLLDE